MKYKIILNPGCGEGITIKVVDSYEEAKKTVNKLRAENGNHILDCYFNNKPFDTYKSYKIEEITEGMFDLEERIKKLMRKYVCHQDYRYCSENCDLSRDGNEHLCSKAKGED